MSAAEAHGGVTIEFDAACVGVNLAAKKMTLSQGGLIREVEYQRLIGADGAGSPVRMALMEATDGECTSDFLDHGYKELCIPAGEGGALTKSIARRCISGRVADSC